MSHFVCPCFSIAVVEACADGLTAPSSLQEGSVRTILRVPRSQAKRVLAAIVLACMACIGLACSLGNSDSSRPPDPPTKAVQYAYVTNTGDNTVSAFKVDTDTGDITLVAVTPVGRAPRAIGFADRGKGIMYVANSGDNTISQFSVSDDGLLHPLTPAVVATGKTPVSLTVNSSSIDVANQGDNTVTHYDAGPDGALQSIGVVSAGLRPSALEPQYGNFVIGAANAILTVPQPRDTTPGQTVDTPYLPSCLVYGSTQASISAEGLSVLYVGDANSNAITAYSVGVRPTILKRKLGVISTSARPIGLSIAPSLQEKYLYALTDDGVVTQYDFAHADTPGSTALPTLVSAIRPPQRPVALKALISGTRELVYAVTDQNSFQAYVVTDKINPNFAHSGATGKNPTAIAGVTKFLPITTTPPSPAPGHVNTTIK